MKKKKVLDKPQKVKTTLEELEVLSHLKGTVEWAIVKRVALRYIANIKDVSFYLPDTNSDILKAGHARLKGKVLGIKELVRMVDRAGKEYEKKEDNGNT